MASAARHVNLDFATGDREFWIINGAHNLCYVHPAQTGIRSDLHLITSSGRVYSFLLTEVSNEAGAEPDLKLFVEPKEQSGIAVAIAPQGLNLETKRRALEQADPSLRNSKPPRWKRDRDLLAWLDSL